MPAPDARRPGDGEGAAAASAAAGARVRRRRVAARPVLGVRDQRRDRPAVPAADPRPVVHPPPVGRAVDAGPPHRRHDGDHGVARPDHGRRRQMTVVGRSWNRLTLPGKVVFTVVPLLLAAPRRRGRRDRAARWTGRDRPVRQHRDRPVRRRRDGDPADHGADRVPDHLHGDEDHRPDESSDRAGPGRAVRLAAVGRPRAQGPHEGGLHPDRRRLGRLHLGAGRDLPRRRHDPARDPVRAGPRRPGLQHRAALLLRHRRPVGRRSPDGRLVELQQVLAARRPAIGGPGRQLRDPADPVGRRADPARRDDEPQPDRHESGRLVHRLVHLPPAARLPDLLHRRHRRRPTGRRST